MQEELLASLGSLSCKCWVRLQRSVQAALEIVRTLVLNTFIFLICSLLLHTLDTPPSPFSHSAVTRYVGQ